MGAPMPGWPGGVQSGLACLGQVMPVCFGVSHPLAGAAMPVAGVPEPSRVGRVGSPGRGLGASMALPPPSPGTPSPLGPSHAVSQGRWRRIKPSRCQGEAARSLATGGLSQSPGRLSWCPSPSHAYLHAPVLASPSRRAGLLLSKPRPKPFLKGEHKAVVWIYCCPSRSAGSAWECRSFLPLLCSRACVHQRFLRTETVYCWGCAACSTVGPSPSFQGASRRSRLRVHFVWIQYICFTAAPAGSPPRLGPHCPRHCPSVGSHCQKKSQGK